MFKYLFFLTLSVSLCSLSHSQKNNVCKNFIDYFFINSSPNCWYDPDVIGDVPTVLKIHNYPMKTYNLTTKDGYNLTMFRMPRKNATKVVVLEHPMTGTASNYMRSGNASLAYNLFDAGYDVWLPNSRGTYYSHTHLNYSDNDYKYWDFSFHEIGIYDLPIQFELVKNVTNRNDLIYIGYSMACTSGIVYASLLPKHAEEHVKVFILIGPTLYIHHQQREPIIPSYNINDLVKISKYVKLTSVFYSFDESSMENYVLCNSHPLKFICVLLMQRTAGGTINNFNPAYVPLIWNHIPTRVSYKVLFHFDQIHHSKRFQHFDYGIMGNLKHYNDTIPPIYPLRNITVPVYFIYGELDTWAPVEDIHQAYDEMTDKAKIYGKYLVPTYNHIDFLYARNSQEMVVDHIINFIGKLK